MASLLLSSLALQISANLLLWAYYKWNQNYISKIFCEKKDIPDNCCKGKCFFKKQVDKQEQLSNSTSPTSKEQKNIKVQNVKESIWESLDYLFLNQNSTPFFGTSYQVYLPKNYLDVLEMPPKAHFDLF
ncbi:MAG: hypothetical protein NZ519_05245 [Bacteroidia bacterium]|nr:hypothetical protein [Bacteroidia bacterium]